jgi:hypothetical protein
MPQVIDQRGYGGGKFVTGVKPRTDAPASRAVGKAAVIVVASYVCAVKQLAESEAVKSSAT